MSQLDPRFPNIRIVLVETTHPGNIGASARAMKAMGFTRMVLVNPEKFPAVEATSLASGADDVLANAKVVSTLEEAIADCHCVIGTSSRSRRVEWPKLNPTEAAERLLFEQNKTEVALVFGQERAGLTNEQLQQCHYHVSIDSNPDFAVLNLSQAVQVLTYEIRRLAQTGHTPTFEDDFNHAELANSQDVAKLIEHMESSLDAVGFLGRSNPDIVMGRLKRIFARARLEDKEVNMLRGVFSAMDKLLENS